LDTSSYILLQSYSYYRVKLISYILLNIHDTKNVSNGNFCFE